MILRSAPTLRRATTFAVAVIVAGAALAPRHLGAQKPPAETAQARPTSVRQSPGWYPNVDPESMSVRIGRRTHAPRVKKPLGGGAHSLDEVGRRVCRFLGERAADSLFALCVTEDEFREILWREFPQSRPATGLTWEDGWRVLNVRLMSGTRDATSDHGGRSYEFVRFERNQPAQDTVTVYKNFKLHHRLVLVARREDGALERMHWLRSVVERKGRFKIYSTTD
ncbi:MAG TPA: hypothetical protein VFP58_12990 [Candidatus Eisenbacteria bacterium]|nr:hypothetical protein [Candidatus Eisenbacteria bacterium]